MGKSVIIRIHRDIDDKLIAYELLNVNDIYSIKEVDVIESLDEFNLCENVDLLDIEGQTKWLEPNVYYIGKIVFQTSNGFFVDEKDVSYFENPKCYIKITPPYE